MIPLVLVLLSLETQVECNIYEIRDDLILHGNNLPFRKGQTSSFIYFLLTFYFETSFFCKEQN